MNHSLARYTTLSLPKSKVPALVEAFSLDACGDHGAALEVLKQAAKANEVEAVVQLGKRLTFGDRAPQSFKDGLNLIQIAAQRGSGEALCFVALLSAMGVYPQSWQKAVEFLVASAQTGWLPAQGQLIALCSDKSLRRDALEGKRKGEIWNRLGKSIDLKFWLARPVITALSESPEIKTVAGFLSPTMCNWLLELGRPKLERAKVYDAYNNKETVSETRTNRAMSFDIHMSDVSTLLVQARISATLSIPVSRMEAFTVLHYATGEEITPHYDFIHPDRADFDQQVTQLGQRCITFIIYLNENYEGGETTFPTLNITNRGKKGDAIYFVNIDDLGRPNMDTLHTGSPPTSGEKWIVTQFVREKQVINIGI